MKVPRSVRRSRLLVVLVSILMVTVAAIGVRLSDPDESSELVRAPLGRATRFETGSLVVSDVRVGSVLQNGDDRVETKGLFVVVHVAARAEGRDSVAITDQRLLADDGLVYLPAFDLGSTVRAEAGFESSGDLVFEVDPARMSGLVLELWHSGFIFRYYERTQTPLGITPANASAWAQAGAGRTVVAGGPVTTGLP